MNKNILFSTTRQWNPGDEFILMGILNVMKSICDFNPVIFNRNPEIQRHPSRFCSTLLFDLPRCRIKRLKPGMYDNSFKEKFLRDECFIDLAVFAGTPEWASLRLRTMYEYVDRYSVPVVYLGVGAGNPRYRLTQLDPLYRRVFERAELVVVRDRFCRDLLEPFGAILLPCPSLLSAPVEFERSIDKVSSIGLIFSSGNAVKHNKIDSLTYRFQTELYRQIIRKYCPRLNVEFICHYVDELPQVRRAFGSWQCNYSYDAGDYLNIYNKFEIVIGARVHGIGLAASMGIPGIHIYHDIRSNSCEAFLAGGVLPDDTGRALELLDGRISAAPELNKQLLSYKKETMVAYYKLLLPVLSKKAKKEGTVQGVRTG